MRVGAEAQPTVSWVIPMGMTKPLGSRDPYTSCHRDWGRKAGMLGGRMLSLLRGLHRHSGDLFPVSPSATGAL